MTLSKRIAATLGLVTVLTLTSGSVHPAQATMSKNVMKLQGQVFDNRSEVTHVTGEVIFDDADRQVVYDFVSDLGNDHLWWPGTVSSTLISGDGGNGSVWEEFIFFGTGLFPVRATLMGTVSGEHVWFTSDGILPNLTHYHLRDGANGEVIMTLQSQVQLPEGVTKEFMEQYLFLTFQNLLGVLGETGEVHVPPQQ